MSRISIATFTQRAPAEALQRRLVENGIHAEVRSIMALEKFWFVSRGEAGVRLTVPADEFERAYHLMAGWDRTEGGLPGAVRCPECRSFRVIYPQYTRRSLLTNFFVGFFTTLLRGERDYYCEECQYTWPKNPARNAAPRKHSAPDYFIE